MSARVCVFGDSTPGPLDPATLGSLVSEARARLGQGISLSTLGDALDAQRAAWTRGGAARTRWLATDPERAVGWSRPMIERGLDHLCTRLSGGALARRVALQLGDPAPLGGFVDKQGLSVCAAPRGVLLLVVAGNVFFGPAEALVVGLATGNVSLVKEPTGDGDFLAHFVRSLGEACARATETLAVLRWRGGDVAFERPLASQADAILVAAGHGTIEAYRRLAGPTTELVEMGPRLSVAVLSARGEGPKLRDLARDVALWEQSACTSVQRVYVQGTARASDLAAGLAAALQALARDLPEGRGTLDERMQVARFREAYAYAGGGAEVLAAPRGSLATVVLDPARPPRPSPLRRNVTVGAFDTLDDLASALAPLRGLLQTVALAAAPDEERAFASLLVRSGAARICAVGEANEPRAEVAHDGTFEMARLVRWVTRGGTSPTGS